jgi:hypothetical protein
MLPVVPTSALRFPVRIDSVSDLHFVLIRNQLYYTIEVETFHSSICLPSVG